MKNYLTINGLSEGIASCEASGLSKCFKAYADNCAGEYILEIGFNSNSGYTYIALDNGITICSMLGRSIEFLIVSFMDEEETFFESYEEALNNFNN